MRNTWATDQYALVFLINYDGENGPICRLQMRIMMMHVNIVHRNASFIGGHYYGSCEACDTWFDPFISKHNAFAATLRKNYAAPMGPLLLQNMPRYRNTRAKRSETPMNSTLPMENDPSDDEDQIISLSVLSNKLRQVKSFPSIYIIPSRFELHDQARSGATMRELNLSKRGFSEAEFKST